MVQRGRLDIDAEVEPTPAHQIREPANQVHDHAAQLDPPRELLHTQPALGVDDSGGGAELCVARQLDTDGPADTTEASCLGRGHEMHAAKVDDVVHRSVQGQLCAVDARTGLDLTQPQNAAGIAENPSALEGPRHVGLDSGHCQRLAQGARGEVHSYGETAALQRPGDGTLAGQPDATAGELESETVGVVSQQRRELAYLSRELPAAPHELAARDQIERSAGDVAEGG